MNKLPFAFILKTNAWPLIPTRENTRSHYMWPRSTTPESKIPTPREWLEQLFEAILLTQHVIPPYGFSFFCFCTKDICIKTESLLLSNSSAPATCALFSIKILSFRPPHQFYKEFSELASLAPFSILWNNGPQVPTHYSSLLLSWAMCHCAIHNLSALIKKCSLVNRALPPRQLQKSSASSLGRVTPKLERVLKTRISRKTIKE